MRWEQLVAELERIQTVLRGGIERVADAIRIDIPRVVDLAALIGGEEDSIAAAHNRLVGQAIIEAEPRREGVLRARMRHLSAIAQDRANAIDAHSRSHPIGGKIRVGVAQAALGVLVVEPEEVVQLFERRGVEVPAQTDTQAQLRAHLPVVLRVGGKVVVDVGLWVAGLIGGAQRSGNESRGAVVISQHHV